jgi:hypothetical protein
MPLTNKQVVEKYLQLKEKSDFKVAQERAEEYLGKNVLLKLSDEKNKKYRILNPATNKYVSFGDIRYEDYTKHKDPVRRQAYLKRATKIKGDWKVDRYSPNNLAINILW